MSSATTSRPSPPPPTHDRPATPHGCSPPRSPSTPTLSASLPSTTSGRKLSPGSNKADKLVLLLTSEPAWPTLKGHLLQLATTGLDPIDVLRDAISQGSIDDARDVAALLDWRIDPTRHLPDGPLPWLPGVPTNPADNPTWGPYLTAQADLVGNLAQQVRTAQPDQLPPWLGQIDTQMPQQVAGDLRVWRAARGVPDHDLRPAGAPATDAAATR